MKISRRKLFGVHSGSFTLGTTGNTLDTAVSNFISECRLFSDYDPWVQINHTREIALAPLVQARANGEDTECPG